MNFLSIGEWCGWMDRQGEFNGCKLA